MPEFKISVRQCFLADLAEMHSNATIGSSHEQSMDGYLSALIETMIADYRLVKILADERREILLGIRQPFSDELRRKVPVGK